MKKRAKGGGLIGGARYEDGDIDWIEEGRGGGGGSFCQLPTEPREWKWAQLV